MRSTRKSRTKKTNKTVRNHPTKDNKEALSPLQIWKKKKNVPKWSGKSGYCKWLRLAKLHLQTPRADRVGQIFLWGGLNNSSEHDQICVPVLHDGRRWRNLCQKLRHQIWCDNNQLEAGAWYWYQLARERAAFRSYRNGAQWCVDWALCSRYSIMVHLPWGKVPSFRSIKSRGCVLELLG